MFTFEDLVREIGQQNRAKWEQVWNDLLRADAPAAGVSTQGIDWDFRVSVKDGGRDITVKRGSSSPKQPLIPDVPSVWSVKSGADGLSPGTLSAELDEGEHPELVTLLKDGGKYFYCVCFPAAADKRKALADRAKQLEIDLGLNPGTVTVLHSDHLADHLKRHPGVLKNHCPLIAGTIGQTAEQWASSSRNVFDPTVAFVDLENRGPIVVRLVEHLTTATGRALRHVAGLSGIGKTRLVYEACLRSGLKDSLLYYPSYSSVLPMLGRIRDNPLLRCTLIVDECTLNDMTLLDGQVQAYGDRVRVVSIGPAGANDKSREFIDVLAPPKDTSVLALLKSLTGETVDAAVLQRLAQTSSHDIRFAIQLLRVVQMDPGLASDLTKLSEALVNPEFLFNRVLALYSADIGDQTQFLKSYRWLTLGREVGCLAPRRNELEFLADSAGVATVALDDIVAQAKACGLGEMPAHLFEAVPRGMATLIFARKLWPTIKPTFRDLLGKAPPDFRQAIMQRVEMCTTELRKEVGTQVDLFFREQLPDPSVLAISTREEARLVRAWVELSPQAGLAWLHTAISDTDVSTLAGFEGSARGMFGGTGPRREIVWAVAHLTCFSEHYDQCEDILFRLAEAENEDIGNNATAEWRQLHRIILSNTECPYPHRMSRLIRRLAAVTPETAELLLDAWIEAVAWPHSAAAPPPVIGGRLVPPEWQPITTKQVYDLFIGVIREGLACIGKWTAELQTLARRQCIESLHLLCKEDTLVILKQLLEPSRSIPDEAASLRRALEEHIADMERASSNPPMELVAACGAWLEELQPTSPAELIRAVVERPPWDYDRLERRKAGEVALSENAWVPHYARAATTAREAPMVLDELEAWLNELQGEGGWAFGDALAELGDVPAIRDRIVRWIRDGKCFSVCGGYCTRTRQKTGDLPEWVSGLLDDLVPSRPEYTARFSAMADPTQRGFDRIMRCAAVDGVKTARVFERLYGYHWDRVLDDHHQREVLEVLLGDTADASSNCSTAIHLLRLYLRGGRGTPIPEPLRSVVLKVVRLATDSGDNRSQHDWKEFAFRLALTDPDSVLEASTELAVNYDKHHAFADTEAIEVLTSLAKHDPEKVLKAVVDAIKRKEYFQPVLPEKWQHLFVQFDGTLLEQVVAPFGVEFARKIGQLMPDPKIGEGGVVVLPQATEWFLRKYGNDSGCLNDFGVGRWNGRVTSGWAWRRTTEVERDAALYMQHPLPAVRAWAAQMLKQHRYEAERDHITYEEHRKRM